jgi:hypothetical protein
MPGRPVSRTATPGRVSSAAGWTWPPPSILSGDPYIGPQAAGPFGPPDVLASTGWHRRYRMFHLAGPRESFDKRATVQIGGIRCVRHAVMAFVGTW